MDYLMSQSCIVDCAEETEDRLLCPSENGTKNGSMYDPLLTPPRSPSRSSSDGDFYLMSTPPSYVFMDLAFDPVDTLDLSLWGAWPSSTSGLKSDLLHDCMWSGTCSRTCRRSEDTLKGQQTSSSSPSSTTEKVELRLKEEPDAPSPALAVDPLTMMPYTPLSDHSYHNQQQMTTCDQPRTPPICDTPSDTDDEIDVVTLPATVTLKSSRSEPADVKPQLTTAKRRPGRPRTVPPLRVVIRPSNQVPEKKSKEQRGRRKRKRLQQRQGSKNLGFKSTFDGGWTGRNYKRYFASHKYANRTESCSSDSEDCVEKRTMHNSMERKRRDDLRFAFQTLREHVPDLASNPKAPKVLILNRAASYARQLSQTGAALEKALKQEARRKRELQRKLMELSKMK